MNNPYAPPRPGGQADGWGAERPLGARPAGSPPEPGRPGHEPAPDGQQRPLREWTGAPQPHTPPPDPEAVREATRPVGTVVMLMLATLLVSGLPLPWQPAALAFGLPALVLGIRAIGRLVRAGLGRSPLIALLAGGLAFTSLMMLTVGSSIALWSIQMENQRCVANALTISAQDACAESYQEALESAVSGWASLLSPGG
ncbi:hypothetical protein [Actinotalea sp.]|uniref:hypothetical protein n=1 Tax=Actinotalea sp. TaxID=1872145 RepID=UPI0035635651